jgi:hypothetical protein
MSSASARVKILFAVLGLLFAVACKKQALPAPAAQPAAAAAVPGKATQPRPGPPDARAPDTRPPALRTAARTTCKDPPSFLTREGAKKFGRLTSQLPLSWGLVEYRDSSGDGGEEYGDDLLAGMFDSTQVVLRETDYFSGLVPNRLARLANGGSSRFLAVYQKWAHKLDSYEPVQMGTLSDHCMPVAPSEDSLLFSIRLSERVALQAVVERDENATDTSEGYYGEGDEPLPRALARKLKAKDRVVRQAQALVLRTVRLPWDGTVLNQGPRVKYYLGLALKLGVFEDRLDAPIMKQPVTPIVLWVGDPPWLSFLTLISRDGEFLLHLEKYCGEQYSSGVSTYRDKDGKPHVEPRDQGHTICISSDVMEKIEAKLSSYQPAKTGAPAIRK